MNIIAQAASGSINLLRLSGPGALEIASALLSSERIEKLRANPRYAALCRLSAKGERIDSALVIYFAAPNSFTGEDVVEFHIHGGYFTAESCMRALLAAGARMAQPGEFSKRACLNGKMSLEQALLINEQINAKSAAAARLINAAIDGAFSELIASARKQIVLALAHIETAIDYADDDLPADIFCATTSQLARAAGQMSAIAERSRQRRGLIEGFCLAIIGVPNAGKSSLLNALLGRERAIVSDEAGTTRDSVEEQISLAGCLLRLIDTAGIREQAGSDIERIGISRSYEAIKRADLLIYVEDVSRAQSADAAALLAHCKASGKPLFIAANKSDLPAANPLANDPHALKISAANGDISALSAAIEEFLKSQQSEELILSSGALIAAFEGASEQIFAALATSELEIAAHHLSAALRELALFGHETAPGELYDAMFSTFCLGK